MSTPHTSSSTQRIRHKRSRARLAGTAALAAVLAVGLPSVAFADSTPQTVQPAQFTQDWANPALITADDSWSGVPGVVGYRGDDITTVTAADPQTLLGEGSVTVDVNANQTNPATFTTGGVAEFALTDPTIALTGSGTADAPNIVLPLNLTSSNTINVRYDLRDLDGSIDNAIQPLALQYRVGTTGAFTNVPAAFVADATSGPSLATLVTSVNVTLPSAVDNQPVVQLRIITANAAGNDEWVGIDNIAVSGLATAGDTAPSVTSTVPADNAAGIAVGADITITMSESVATTGAFSVTCTTSGAHPVTVTGGPTVWTLNPDTDFVAGESCTVTVTASLVTDTDAIDPPDTMAANYVFTFATVAADPCTSPFAPISSIQGSGSTSPIPGVRTTKGVVVGDYELPTGGTQANYLRGFFLQDATGDADAATSDGIFVFNANNDSVALGDVVVVTGTVGEFQDQTQLSSVTSLTKCGTGTVAPTDVTLPAASATAFEAYEGMLVRFPQTLFVTEHFQLGRFGQVVVSSGDRLRQPTSVVAPGAPATALQAANNLSRVIIDDALQSQNPDPIVFGRNGTPLSASNTLRGGDTTTGSVGVLTYTWAGNAASGNAFRLRPINALNGAVQFVEANTRPTAPTVAGTLKVAGFNLLNFFNTFDGLPDTVDNCLFGTTGAAADCRGADTQAEFDRQWPKTVSAITSLNVDVLGVNEIENDGYSATSAIAFLVDKLNAATAPGTYAFIDVDQQTGQVDALGSDAIKVGVIYKPGSVTPVGATAALNTVAFVNAGDSGPRNRASLAQAFEQNSNGARFVVNVNHLKSKGSACDAPATADGQGNCAAVRASAATQLAAWLATDPTGTADPDILLLGDYNSYAKEDSITALITAGFTNLAESLIGANAYSYVFDGQWGYLDYALSSASMLSQVAGVEEFHINADEPSVLDYNTDFKTANLQATLYAPDQYRVSDHDPVVVGLSLNKPATTTTLTAAPSGLIAGQLFDLTASVAAVSGSAVPAGSVAFSDGSPLGSVAVDALGKAMLAQQRGAGTFNYSSAFTGSARFGDSTGTLTVNVVQAPSTVTLNAPGAASVGTSVSLTAQVSSAYLRPGGTVTFFDGTADLSGPIALVAGATPTAATAAFSWTASPVGPRSLTAVYSGDSNVLAATSAASPVTVTESATVSIADSSAVEGNSGTSVMTFSVSLSNALTVPVSLTATTTNGTATAPSDFGALAAVPIDFAPGQTSKTVSVNVVGDGVVELDEAFQVVLSGTLPSGSAFARSTATGTITNDDIVVAIPVLRIRQVCTGINNAQYQVFTWTVRNRGTATVTFSWRVKNAVPSQTGTATVAAGALSAPFTTDRSARNTTLQVLVNGRVVDELDAEKNRASCRDNDNERDSRDD